MAANPQVPPLLRTQWTRSSDSFEQWCEVVGKSPKRQLWVDTTMPTLCLLSACLHVRVPGGVSRRFGPPAVGKPEHDKKRLKKKHEKEKVHEKGTHKKETHKERIQKSGHRSWSFFLLVLHFTKSVLRDATCNTDFSSL